MGRNAHLPVNEVPAKRPRGNHYIDDEVNRTPSRWLPFELQSCGNFSRVGLMKSIPSCCDKLGKRVASDRQSLKTT